jgi:hypothetical protein
VRSYQRIEHLDFIKARNSFTRWETISLWKRNLWCQVE